jgi:hypothetical protein
VSGSGAILIVAAALVGGTTMRADAQQPVPVPVQAAPNGAATGPATTTDSTPLFTPPNGLLLRAGTLTYQIALRRDTVTTSLGARRVDVAEANLGGVPGWLIAESRTGTTVATSDSLFVHRSDLSPERWIATVGRTELAVSFTRDSMFAALQSYQGRTSFAAALPAGALLTPAMTDRILELLPLASGFRVAASLVQIDGGTPRAVPATLTVDREESVALLDRLVDCWVVTLRAGALEKRYWVSKEAPRVVKTEQAASGGLLTELLM